MRACALVDVGRFEMLELGSPVVGVREVLVRPMAVGLCGTDFHIFAGEANYHLDRSGRAVALREAPQVLGHEIAGEVLEVGAEVLDLRAGDRVVLDQGLNCHSSGRRPVCDACGFGASHQCEFYAEHGITGLPGGFAERLAIPAVNALRFEVGVAAETAVLSEPLACVLHSLAALERAGGRYQLLASERARRVETVLVQGAGPGGLLFVEVLRRVVGFSGRLLVSEPDARKRARAEAFGAQAIDPLGGDLVTAVAEATGGAGVELLIEASGSGAALVLAPRLIRKQASVVKYGIGYHGEGLERLNELQWKEPTLLLPVGASSGFDADGRPSGYRQALAHITSGRVRAGELVSHRYQGLDSVPTAFAGAHREPGYSKGVVIL
jgi:L-iditol 2-dehydrogenase